jgi:hypothetical protein
MASSHKQFPNSDFFKWIELQGASRNHVLVGLMTSLQSNMPFSAILILVFQISWDGERVSLLGTSTTL